MNPAWEVRDQADQAEDYYSHPLRAKNRELEEENFKLKRILRKNGITWPNKYGIHQTVSRKRTRSSTSNASIPYLPPEIMLKILSYSLASRYPIIDPLGETKKEHLTPDERGRPNQIAIHFLATCKAYYEEGKKMFWTQNTFTFTSVQSVKLFSEVDASYRRLVKQANLRVIARFYDDEDRPHRLPRDHHEQVNGRPRLRVTRRAKEPTLARRGFRTYAWYQLVDFLEALLPPHIPGHDHATPRPRLMPNLEVMRIDLVNFGDDMFQYPPAQLHDVASHQLGCSLNELIVTGLPGDDPGSRTGTELSGLLKDDGLMITHAPTLIALKQGGLRVLQGSAFVKKVVRSMRPVTGVNHHHHDDHPDYFDEFPPAPPEEGDPPYSQYLSCRTIWKRVPIWIEQPHKRQWVLFDRVSGLPWEDVRDEALMFDFIDDEDEDDGIMCENCGEIHPGAILAEELMDDLYDDEI
ncbi:uncharacterized protein PG998_003904 [Apiospora kogelbergensis]|uniref:F-box domain-containing protein n=1 Tax=Apiospora kogelbergensis TaxID=1337665 RepID=A0AAW0QT36_9PEZI